MILDKPHAVQIATEDRTLVAVDEFSIPRHRMTVLLGESGIGKSLLAKALYGLLEPGELSVTIDGRPYREYRSQPATQRLQRQSFFVFQEPSTHLNPLLTIEEQLNEGSLAGASHQEEILRELWKGKNGDTVEKLLHLYPKPHRPSGGEKQRMLIAMAFKKMDMVADQNPVEDALFVFDEPTGSLDNYYRDVFLEMLFDRFRRHRSAVLLITHDYSMIGRIHDVHADVLRHIVFRELVSVGDRVYLRDFEPRKYLQWWQSLQPATVQAGQVILTIEPNLDVHGRHLVIVDGRDSSKPSPLVLKRGELVYLKAPSGVGKTTLAKTIMGLLNAQTFSARLKDYVLNERTPLHEYRRKIWGKAMTLVFQHADEALNLESTVRSALRGLPSLKRMATHEVVGAMRELFDEVDRSFLARKIKHLSGGQKQRLNLLRGFLLDTDVMILDEPLNGLDFGSAGTVIQMIQRKQQAGKSILLISHNEEIFDRIVTPSGTYYLRATDATP